MMPAAATNLVAAAFLVAGWLALTILSLRRYRQREARAGRGDVSSTAPLLIVHASQTGFAERLAEQTAEVFAGGGIATRLASLNSLSADALATAGRVLFVVSTTGEGDPPDSAIAFARRVLDRPADLSTLRFGLLALGDRSYEDYCGFGRRLDAWLRHSGATALFDRVEVDDGDAAALRHWQHHLGRLSSRSDLPDWSPPRYGRWTLAARRWMNPGSVGGPVFHLELTPAAGEDATWTAGDIAEIGPEHSAAEVARWLARAGRDGAARVHGDAGETTLAQALARCVLPTDIPDHALDDQAWLDGLPRLPHREYSIASVPGDGAVHLLIRQLRRPDGSLGLGAGWLTEHAALGAPIALRLSRNRAFHPPADAVPLILVGNGTGLAGLRALLHSRAGRPGTRQWLLFGERERAHDFFYGEQLLALQASGGLERLDLAFSRDPADPAYVQQRLLDHADLVRQWVADGAAVYVCGSLDGMAPGVDAALSTILGAEALESLTTQGRYRRDVY
jgi:sulfite reductase (NADPH) flavoprotein alpha-component